MIISKYNAKSGYYGPSKGLDNDQKLTLWKTFGNFQMEILSGNSAYKLHLQCISMPVI